MSLPLSVIVVGYNMARELPRTIRSLSPAMQRGIDAGDYEIILIDNGSSQAFDEEDCRRWGSDLRIHRVEDAGVSPAPAINLGLRMARGKLVGVCIDGARMASPGLLATALAASGMHPRPVIGTLAFHLGPDVQMRSIHQGYDQAAEDALMAASGWEDDGYRLFDISVFAGSSRNGWFVMPNESNAIFMAADHWSALGGYDEQFVTPGGGMANPDMWRRACEDPSGQPIMLLGEATFHQVHGGVATNAPAPPSALFNAEYQALRGEGFRPPRADPWLFGRLNRPAIESMKRSLELWAESQERRDD